MADYIKQLEPMIYYSQWQATMDLRTIAIDSAYVSQLADSNQDEYYVLILNLTDTLDFSMDIGSLTSIAKIDPRILAYVCINGDNTAKFIGGILTRLAKQNFKFFDSYDEAIQYARKLIQQAQA